MFPGGGKVRIGEALIKKDGEKSKDIGKKMFN